MKAIVILLDSLTRDYLQVYNSKANTITPNIDRFCKDALKFNQHYIGSAPCMPARRDIFTGRMHFLERDWGGIEPFDVTFPSILGENQIMNHMITDHTHYVEIGGENYLQQFDTWECIRGQEMDHWVSRYHKPQAPEKYYGQYKTQYELNRSQFFTEADYPTPKTFQKACEWVEDNRDADNYFLMVEGFDPHEPFDAPENYMRMYESSYEGIPYNWSGYDEVHEPPEATEHLRNCYKATLTMTDHWLGKFIDTLKENNQYNDTLIIFTTDHGHLLGEHGFVGKNLFHAYQEMSHIPMLIHFPGNEYVGECDALTQNIDLMPTILSYFGLEIPDSVKGKSLWGVIRKEEKEVRESCIFGWHGSCLNITDGKHTYFQTPNPDAPLYDYCGVPTTIWRYIQPENYEEIEMGRFLKYTRYPVYRFRMSGEVGKYVKESLLFDDEADPKQLHPIKDEKIVSQLKEKMTEQLQYHQAPDEVYDRFYLKEK